MSIAPAPAPDTLAGRLAAVRARIAAAAERAGRDPGEVRLLPVSKTFGEAQIRAAVALGLTRLGENKVQEIRDKHGPLADCGIDWVMIGHLQTNKARHVVRLVSEVQSLDRLELAEALERRVQAEGRALDVLLQVKTSGEPGKYGLAPGDLLTFARTVARDMRGLRIRGLMTLAANSDDEAEVRACFRNLRELRDRLRGEAIDGVDAMRLSMGMSGDFELAIEEGSTEVRVGSGIFGHRDYGRAHYWPEGNVPPAAGG